MSRIGKKAIEIPDKVKINVANDGAISVEGPKGQLGWTLPREIKGRVDGNNFVLERSTETRQVRALHGLARALVNNMVTGVNAGFVKDLEIHGVGFKAAMKGKDTLTLSVGYSHDVVLKVPAGVEVKVGGAKQELLSVSGIDKQAVGEMASVIRASRKPEPYQGKGVRYKGEYIFRKEGKKK